MSRDISQGLEFPALPKPQYGAPGSYRRIGFLRGKHGQHLNFRHRTIKHSDGVYVRGDIHTNTVEGFWSLIKRGISGVYHPVSKQYLQSYLDEFVFRYNRRHEGNQQFKAICSALLCGRFDCLFQ